MRRAESHQDARFGGAEYHRTWSSVFHATASASKSARTWAGAPGRVRPSSAAYSRRPKSTTRCAG